MWTKLFIVSGGLSGAAGVVLGALSAHALRARISAAELETLKTVAAYALVHGLLLLVVATWVTLQPALSGLRIAGSLIVAGVFLFCGGLSLSILGGVGAVSAAAPAGGMCFIAAWLILAWVGLVSL